MKAVKAGRAMDNAAAAANQPRVNTDGWRKLIKAFTRSLLREMILSSFSQGNWECDFIKKERHALAFLALELYFEGSGCRFDIISRMTVGYVLDATLLAKPCPWCQEKTRNLKRHKKHCQKAQKAKEEGAVSGNEDNDEDARERVVRIMRHKTSGTRSTDGGLILVLPARFYKILCLWIRTKHRFGEEDRESLLFEGIRWDAMMAVLAKLVGQKVMEESKESGPIGSKAMRQFASTVFMKNSATPDESMRR